MLSRREHVVPVATAEEKDCVSAGKSSTACCEAEWAKRFSVEDAGFQQGEQFDTDAIGG